MIADDLAYGHELNAGFQRAFEDAGGKVVQKLWPPLDCARLRHLYRAAQSERRRASSSALPARTASSSSSSTRSMAATPLILGGMTAVDEALLQQMGDEALGMISTCWYSAPDRHPDQQEVRRRHAPRLQRSIPASTPRRPIPTAAVLEAALQQDRRQDRGQGRADGGVARSNKVETARGPGELRQIRQRGRQRLHPQGREEGRQAASTP